MKIRENIQFTYQNNVAKKKNMLIYYNRNDFNTFMCDYTLHRRKKYFCRYYLQDFRTVKKLKFHIKDCFKINGKQRIKMLKR